MSQVSRTVFVIVFVPKKIFVFVFIPAAQTFVDNSTNLWHSPLWPLSSSKSGRDLSKILCFDQDDGNGDDNENDDNEDGNANGDGDDDDDDDLVLSQFVCVGAGGQESPLES